MDLHEALAQISEIRQHVARSETFRGYRAAPVAFSGVVACLAAAFQAVALPQPAEYVEAYLLLWVGAAMLSMAVTGATMFWYCRRSASSLTQTNMLLAVGQFLPAVVAGALVTLVVYRKAPDALGMLPGLWAVFFSLGIFASWRLLPRATFGVGVYYLAAGVANLWWAAETSALSPWTMILSFGVGQFLAAGILYWTLERSHVEPCE
jgi:hypothetical protein